MNITIISDTHQKHNELKFINQEGIIIHCGDFTSANKDKEATKHEDFMQWYSNLKFQYKILVLGNHEFEISKNIVEFEKECIELGIILLNDSGVEIDGVKFYGTPWVFSFREVGAYSVENIILEEKFNLIPDDTNVLISHTPPYSILDKVYRGNVGSPELKKKIKDLHKLKYHFFGHIHESVGKLVTKNNVWNVNASMVLIKEPFVIEY
jgi:Icc-related predicted phosphoesterase